MTSTGTSPVLEGIRVLDLSRALAAPWASQLLADFGAEVIKVERPGRGDDFRAAPPFLKDRDGKPTAESVIYQSANRNKKSITIDIANPEGQELIRRLSATSDVLIENYKVDDLARYGLAYEKLKEANPGLIYCSVTGFGQTGPYRSRPGYDSIFQALSGMMSLTGYADNEPGGGPLRTGPSVTDVTGGMYAAFAIVLALYKRKETGAGQYIDISLLDTTMALIAHMAGNFLIAGVQPERIGSAIHGGAPNGVIRCADGRIVISASADEPFARLCAILKKPELLVDARFENPSARVRNRPSLLAEIESSTTQWSCRDLLDMLERARLPAAPVNDLAAAFQDPQIVHRQMVEEVPHPLAGAVKLIRNPIRTSGATNPPSEAPPLLGQHNEQVLCGVLGLSRAELDGLKQRGVI